MGTKVVLDGVEVDLDALTPEGMALYRALDFSHKHLEELNNLLAVLTKAKKAYMEDLKQEIVMKLGGFL